MIFFSIEDAFYQKTILDCLVQIDQKIVSADNMNSFCDVSIAVDGKKIKKVMFGDPNMEIRKDNAAARKSFRARHKCDTATDKTSARYWSCKMW